MWELLKMVDPVGSHRGSQKEPTILGNLHLLESPGQNNNMSTSDRFETKRGK